MIFSAYTETVEDLDRRELSELLEKVYAEQCAADGLIIALDLLEEQIQERIAEIDEEEL